jgi:hypothetical protein
MTALELRNELRRIDVDANGNNRTISSHFQRYLGGI